MAKAPKTAENGPKTAENGGKPPKFTVEMWPISKPVPYERNPRVLTEAAIRKVAQSIKDYGWQQPITVDPDGVIVTGHTRLEAAKVLGLDKVPVKVITGLTPAKIQAYRIADNRVAEETDWNNELLTIELGELNDMSLDIGDLGFNQDEIDKLWSDTFSPKLAPEAQRGDVTDADVAKADAGLKNRATEIAKQELIDVICPHCAKSFALERSVVV